MAGLTTNVMANMSKDKPITIKNLEKICKALDCTPNDVFSFDGNYRGKIMSKLIINTSPEFETKFLSYPEQIRPKMQFLRELFI